ncbi:MAG: Crp/Fnr family transcriptional regulator [Bacteroidota bacterium]
MKDLIRFLSNFHPIKEEILETYVSHWTEHSAKKKSILTEADQTERYLYFVKEGIQKSYYLNDGKEHIMFFAYAPSFSGVMESFLTQSASRYFLETITNSQFLRISYVKHKELITQHRELETLFRKITEFLLLGVIERHHEMLAYNAETRLRTFLKRSPHLINMVSQKDMASYLKIDATNFSKMMKNIKI